MTDVDWKQLKEYKCPLPGCGASLRQMPDISDKDESFHVCTECPFHISDKKLCSMTVIRHRKIEPPNFIQEMRNQEELNNL